MRGILAIQSKGNNCLGPLFLGLFNLQHRGQVYCGMSTNGGGDDLKIRTHRGLVLTTFADDLTGLEGKSGIGSTSNHDRQPILKYSRFGSFAIACDGYIKNSKELRTKMMNAGDCLSSIEDVELLASIITRESNIVKGIERAMKTVKGSFSVAILTSKAIYAARTSNGLNPLILGKGEDGWIVASESTVFNNGGFKIFRDVNPGEIVRLDSRGIKTVKQLEAKKHICNFTWVYFAQPDSIIDGVSVAAVRHNLGRFLAEDDKVEADIVAPVPFSGIMHAEGYHLASGLPLLAVFKLPQYILRTYNLPIEYRLDQQSMKLSVIRENVDGKRIILVDDSIRAGVIMKGTIAKLRQNGAKEVHVRIASPVSFNNCPYAPAPTSAEKYIAKNNSIEKIRKIIGADTLQYTKLENISKAIGIPAKDLCSECFKL